MKELSRIDRIIDGDRGGELQSAMETQMLDPDTGKTMSILIGFLREDDLDP